MPELPEVETVRRGLEPSMQGATLTAVLLHRPDLRFAIPPRLTNFAGRRIETLGRRGKYLLLNLSGGDTVIVHLGMSGSIRVGPAAQVTRDSVHDHVQLHFRTEKGDDFAAIYHDPRRFGFFDVCPTTDLASYPAFAAMGPEPFDPSFDGPYLKSRLSASRAPIKQALLDQSVVAGLGNIYVCEALFRAGIDPRRKAAAVSGVRTAALAGHIRDVLTDALNSGGSTLRDHRGVDGSLGYFQHRFDVYDRAGDACRNPDCQTTGKGCITRLVQAGRSTFFCPNCQH